LIIFVTLTQTLIRTFTRGRTQHFNSISADREFSAGCYLFTVSNSCLYFSHGRSSHSWQLMGSCFTTVTLNRGGSMVSGALGKISRLCPHEGRTVGHQLFLLSLPSLVPPPLVPWAAAPVAYPSIHHWPWIWPLNDPDLRTWHKQCQDEPCSKPNILVKVRLVQKFLSRHTGTHDWLSCLDHQSGQYKQNLSERPVFRCEPAAACIQFPRRRSFRREVHCKVDHRSEDGRWRSDVSAWRQCRSVRYSWTSHSRRSVRNPQALHDTRK